FAGPAAPLSASGHTTPNGPSTPSGASFSSLDGRTVDNFGSASVPAGQSITFTNNAAWTNRPGSTFTLPDSAALSQFFSPGSLFDNQGLLLKSGPAGTASIGFLVNNSRSLVVQAGTPSLRGLPSSGMGAGGGGAVLRVGRN